jgi:hypothetical protein
MRKNDKLRNRVSRSVYPTSCDKTQCSSGPVPLYDYIKNNAYINFTNEQGGKCI